MFVCLFVLFGFVWSPASPAVLRPGRKCRLDPRCAAIRVRAFPEKVRQPIFPLMDWVVELARQHANTHTHREKKKPPAGRSEHVCWGVGGERANLVVVFGGFSRMS